MISSWEKQINKSNLLYIAYWFFSLAIVLTVGLFAYNSYLSKSIESVTNEIAQIDWSISKIQENRSIQVYNLIQENKKVLATLEKKSKVKDFIYHIRSLEIPFGLTFKWFNYTNWNLSMQVLAPFDSNTLASNRVSMFIKAYREDKNAPFELWFVNTFNWFDSMTFSVNFKLK